MPPVSFSTDQPQRIETINSRDFYIYIQVLLLCKEWTKITITVIRVVLSFQNNKLNINYGEQIIQLLHIQIDNHNSFTDLI
jgi:hypothetical protein